MNFVTLREAELYAKKKISSKIFAQYCEQETMVPGLIIM